MFQDGYLSLNVEGVFAIEDFVFVEDFNRDSLAGGGVYCSFDFAESAAADGTFYFEVAVFVHGNWGYILMLKFIKPSSKNLGSTSSQF